MRTCPYCGEKLPTGSAFCPNCGAAVQRTAEDPAAGGRRNLRIAWVAAAAAAVIALAAAVMIIPGLFSTPEKQFISYHEELFMDKLLSGLAGRLDRYGSGLSTDLTVTASVDDPSIDQYLAGSSINLGVDVKKDSVIANGELVLMGSSVLSGTVTYDDGKLGFLLPQADENYYVMDLKQVVKTLTGEDIDAGDAQLPEITGKQVRSLIEAYLDVVYSTVTRENLAVEKNRDVRLDGLGSSFTGTVYTFTPTAQDIEDLLIRLADRLESDEDLRGLISQLLASEAMIRLVGGYAPYGSTVEDELDAALLEAAGELHREAARIGRQVESSGFSWVLAVEGKAVRQISISAQNGSAFVYETEGTESDRLTELLYVVSHGDKQDLVEHSYTRKGNESDGRITVTIPYEGSAVLDYRMDRGKTSVFDIPYGEYRVSIPSENISVSLSVADGVNGGVDHTLSISADSYYYDFSRLSLTVNATDHSSVSKPSQRAVDISNYSEAEFYHLFFDIGSALGNELLRNLPLFGLLYGR